MNQGVRKTVFLALMASVALILAYVESLLPPIWAAVPGIKLGLPNIVTVTALYVFGPGAAVTVSLLRVALAALLFGTPLTFAYSLAGAALSFVLMMLFKKMGMFSTIGVSVIGGVGHNLGQILMAILILERAEIGYYMAVLTLTGIVAGVFIGLAGALAVKRLNALDLRLK